MGYSRSKDKAVISIVRSTLWGKILKLIVLGMAFEWTAALFFYA